MADFGARRRLRSASSPSLNVCHRWLAIELSRLLQPILGTVCHNMSRLKPLCMFSEVASRFSSSSSAVLSHDFYRNFCSAFAVTGVIFGHFFTFFFTYYSGNWTIVELYLLTVVSASDSDHKLQILQIFGFNPTMTFHKQFCSP